MSNEIVLDTEIELGQYQFGPYWIVTSCRCDFVEHHGTAKQIPILPTGIDVYVSIVYA